MNTHITLTLAKLFERHRDVFWYDPKRELWADFMGQPPLDAECIEIDLDHGVKTNCLKFGTLPKKPLGIDAKGGGA